jgi:phenylalanyl-tRNA synthetase alpha chain
MDFQHWLERIQGTQTLDDLNGVRSGIFGKSGQLTAELKALGALEPESRKERSALLNGYKSALLTAMDVRKNQIEHTQWALKLDQERIDVTLPCAPLPGGKGHPLHQVMQEVIDIFSMLGFSVRRGPDVETEFHNFDALNVPKDHPARAAQDTFYMPKGYVLRTQTSPVQIRTLTSEPLPLRIISPGRVYRADHDRTHSPMFHQVECLVVEPGIHMGHLKGCLSAFLDHFFGRSVTMRFRPSFFPFTSPSAEVDIAYHRKDGRLHMGSGESWMEILGCGMVNPKVFQACNLADDIQGFAAGMGLERLAMLKYGIEDIRHIYQNDQRWLDHFGASFH